MSQLLKSLKSALECMNHESYNDALSALTEAIEVHEKQLSCTQDIVNVQCNDGNWDYDAYMHGMANGMLLVQSVLTDKTPEFLEAPEVWLESLSHMTTDTTSEDLVRGSYNE